MAERDTDERSSLQIVFNSAVLRWLDELAEQGVFTTDKDLRILTWNKWLEIRSGPNGRIYVLEPLGTVLEMFTPAG